MGLIVVGSILGFVVAVSGSDCQVGMLSSSANIRFRTVLYRYNHSPSLVDLAVDKFDFYIGPIKRKKNDY